jgi:hypothetical protein
VAQLAWSFATRKVYHEVRAPDVLHLVEISYMRLDQERLASSTDHLRCHHSHCTPTLALAPTPSPLNRRCTQPWPPARSSWPASWSRSTSPTWRTPLPSRDTSAWRCLFDPSLLYTTRPTTNDQQLTTDNRQPSTRSTPRSDELLAVLGDQAAAKAGSFLPQNLTNTVWGFSQLGAAHPRLFDAVAAEAKRRRLEGFNTQNLSDLAWAMSVAGQKVGQKSAGSRVAVASAAQRPTADGRPTNRSNQPTQTMQPTHSQDPELFDQIATAAAAAADEASPHSLSDLAWAYANAGHAAPGLFAAISRAAAGKLNDRFSLGMLSDLLWWVGCGLELPGRLSGLAAVCRLHAVEGVVTGLF